MTPNRRRQAVIELEDVFGVSQRRACRVVGQPRATQRLAPPKPSAQEQQLREWLRAFSKRRPRWGWRRAAKGLRREGWEVNDKKVRRLWRDEGLRVPQKRRKKRLTGIGARVGLMSLLCPNALWAMDFQFDTTVNGRTIKMLNVIDEFTREALATETHRSIDPQPNPPTTPRRPMRLLFVDDEPLVLSGIENAVIFAPDGWKAGTVTDHPTYTHRATVPSLGDRALLS